MGNINFNPNTMKADKWSADNNGNSSWWNTAKNQLEQAGKSATSQEIAKLAEEIKNYTMEKNTAVAERDGQLAAGDTIFVPLEYAMEEISASVEEGTNKCTQLQGDLDNANTALNGATQNVSAKYSRYQNVKNEYNSADDNHKAQLESMLGSAKRAYDEAVKEQEAKQKELETVKSELEAAKKNIENLKSELEELKAEYQEEKESYEDELKQLDEKITTLTGQITESETKLGEAREKQTQAQQADEAQKQAQAQNPEETAQDPSVGQDGEPSVLDELPEGAKVSVVDGVPTYTDKETGDVYEQKSGKWTLKEQAKTPENSDEVADDAETLPDGDETSKDTDAAKSATDQDKLTDAFGNLYELPEGANVSVINGVPTYTDEESGNVYEQNARTGRWDLVGTANAKEAYEVPDGTLFELPDNASVTTIDGIPTYVADDGTKYQQDPNGLWVPTGTTAPVEYDIPEGSLSAPPAGSDITVIDGVVTCVTEDGNTYEQNPETGMWEPAETQTPDHTYEVPEGALFEPPEGAHVGVIDGTPTFVSDDGTTYVQNPDGLWVPYGPHAHNDAYEVPEGAMFELPEGASPTIENGVPTYIADDGTKYQKNSDGLWVPTGKTKEVSYPAEDAKIQKQIDDMKYVFDKQSPKYDDKVANYFKDNGINLEEMFMKKLETKDADTAAAEMNNYIANMGKYINKKSEVETKRNDLTSKDLSPTQKLILQTEYGKDNILETMTSYQTYDTFKGYDGSSAWDKEVSKVLGFYDKLSSEADGIKDSIDVDAKLKDFSGSNKKQINKLINLYDTYMTKHGNEQLTGDSAKLKDQAESVIKNYLYRTLTDYNIQSVLNTLEKECQ